MALNLLRIHNLRNIQRLELEPRSGINLLCGDNAAGKTTLLEAIYLLGRGRSFRGGRFSSIVREDCRSLEVFGLVDRGKVSETRIGFCRENGQNAMKLSGENVKRLSDIAKRFPLQLMTPRSHEILERGPDNRRRFIEWGVFHVEHEYFDCYKRYKRALAQRNGALRTDPRNVRAWNGELIRSGELLNKFRLSYKRALERVFRQEAGEFLDDMDISIDWRPGWKRDKGFADSLDESLESDISRGHTQFGPHRADFLMKLGSFSAVEKISRGQQKMLIAALQIAQARVAQDVGSITPTVLVDDLAAELDRKHRERFFNRLDALKTQVFVTMIDSSNSANIEKVFHVEHGCIT